MESVGRFFSVSFRMRCCTVVFFAEPRFGDFNVKWIVQRSVRCGLVFTADKVD